MKNDTKAFQNVPVAVLCGGRSVTIGDLAPSNKALVSLCGKPLFWWVLRHYASYGATQFIMAIGLQSERFAGALQDLGASVQGQDAQNYSIDIAGVACQVRLLPTAVEATTAQRLLACKPWLFSAERFALTYSDTLSDVDLSAEMRFHISQNLIATLLSARPPVRFRILGMRQGESLVRAFAPRPVIENTFINGGYYLFNQTIWDAAWEITPDVALENQPLERLAVAGKLAAYEHRGAWHYCDGERDLDLLQGIARALENSAA